MDLPQELYRTLCVIGIALMGFYYSEYQETKRLWFEYDLKQMDASSEVLVDSFLVYENAKYAMLLINTKFGKYTNNAAYMKDGTVVFPTLPDSVKDSKELNDFSIKTLKEFSDKDAQLVKSRNKNGNLKINYNMRLRQTYYDNQFSFYMVWLGLIIFSFGVYFWNKKEKLVQ